MHVLVHKIQNGEPESSEGGQGQQGGQVLEKNLKILRKQSHMSHKWFLVSRAVLKEKFLYGSVRFSFSGTRPAQMFLFYKENLWAQHLRVTETHGENFRLVCWYFNINTSNSLAHCCSLGATCHSSAGAASASRFLEVYRVLVGFRVKAEVKVVREYIISISVLTKIHLKDECVRVAAKTYELALKFLFFWRRMC